ncbi:gibberellin 20-oxidase, putative [Talaromyces stipitatus ATCC 10500]|uniref:Gibberellin 20-oxidase, putative n=1 Tax=Talaromyces stipitatus (strain ATCC 10500 / CBS 375.48 / QM 6759 / NRRL 1006) TaxID=441959 RepID=B8MMA9_TALSN|nr:gibberellin 20-oxidase, putative [Talaromyces stipitatus ATCC 10500]EED13663.1 gibberellin 20-oxidase, putative [Talaromyces stipitatus ATCC 10500]
MSTTFSSLPIVDLAPLRKPEGLSDSDQVTLSTKLYNVFATTGFAYLVNTPLTFKHADVFDLALEFFNLPLEKKMNLAKRTFKPENLNTYRGYFPVQPNDASDNLKEGFEIGPPQAIHSMPANPASRFNLTEPNVWPDENTYPSRSRLEQLYIELQSLSSTILSLLASSLDKPADFFTPYLTDSLSTLRLLHYPPSPSNTTDTPIDIDTSTPPPEPSDPVKLSCTPHTDSGILTLLHQDSTGGLEVQDSSGKWVPAPYVPESVVVNIGDLMAKVSGGRFVATMHRVRAPPPSPFSMKQHGLHSEDEDGDAKFGRFSAPFFFEPGENCLVHSVDTDPSKGVLYGNHVLTKMEGFVEYKS